MDPATLASELFASRSRAFAVRLWDGTDLPPAGDAGVRGRVVLRDPRALEAFLPPAAEHRVAEAILDGLVELGEELRETDERGDDLLHARRTAPARP